MGVHRYKDNVIQLIKVCHKNTVHLIMLKALTYLGVILTCSLVVLVATTRSARDNGGGVRDRGKGQGLPCRGAVRVKGVKRGEA